MPACALIQPRASSRRVESACLLKESILIACSFADRYLQAVEQDPLPVPGGYVERVAHAARDTFAVRQTYWHRNGEKGVQRDAAKEGEHLLCGSFKVSCTYDFTKQKAGSLTFGMLPVHRYVLPPLFPEERPALEIKDDGEDKQKRAPGALAQARTHERDGP